MNFSAGTRLGPYEIVALLGAGGMGEVYRARDPRIGREVAIKVLPASVSENQDRFQRFQQEARTAGMLNHPNLLMIHELGLHKDAPYIVSELLEGETLRDRLRAGALSVQRSVDYAMQIAQGLAAAHEKRIVHRDLKPENLFVTKDSRVKILDFGLAKLSVAEDGRSESPTIRHATAPGLVLGTASYMSPEQVRGEQVDARSDIFSFGSIFYEMLSGKRPFTGDSSVEIMNAILKEDPKDISESAPNITPALGRIVRHCLEKHPEGRFQSARDLAFDLETISGFTSTTPLRSIQARRRIAPGLVVGIALIVTAVLAFFGGRQTKKISTPTFHRLTFRQGSISGARFAPDGQNIIYAAAWDQSGRGQPSSGGSAPIEIFETRAESPESRPLQLSRAGILAVSRSGELAVQLDRHFIGSFTWIGTLARVPLSGGAPREILEGVQAADWDPAGEKLAIMRRVGGENRLEYPIGKVLYKTAGWISHPRISPRGDSVAFLDHPIQGDDGGTVNVIGGDGKVRTLSTSFGSVLGLAWSPNANEVWFSAARTGVSRSVYAVSLRGKERLVLSSAGTLTLHDISKDGRFLVTQHNVRMRISALMAGDASERDLSWLDWGHVRDFSDDGRFVLSDESGEGAGTNYGVYLRKTDGTPAIRLGDGAAMSLSSDAKQALAIRSLPSPAQIFSYPTGTGEAKQITHDSINHQWAGWIGNGSRILFAGNEPGRGLRFYVQDVGRDPPKPISGEGASVYGNAISQDGTVVASPAVDQRIVLYSLQGGPPRYLPESLTGAIPIRWSADGRSLYLFRRGEEPIRVYRFQLLTSRLEIAKEIPLSAGGMGAMNVRVTPDGKSYVHSYIRDIADLYLVEEH